MPMALLELSQCIDSCMVLAAHAGMQKIRHVHGLLLVITQPPACHAHPAPLPVTTCCSMLFYALATPPHRADSGGGPSCRGCDQYSGGSSSAGRGW